MTARRFAASRCGTTAIEYALIAGSVSIVILVAVTGLGSNMKTVFYDKLVALF